MHRRSPTRNAHPDYSDAISVTRFWHLVDIGMTNECWNWLGDTDRDGYGVFVYRGKRYGAHELALSFTTGEKRLESLDTCHSCDTPTCVNPAHLRFDTRVSNIYEMHARGRAARAGRLSDDDVVLIRERRAAGARQKDLAKQFGISNGQVSMIVHGLRWPNTGGPVEGVRSNRKVTLQ